MLRLGRWARRCWGGCAKVEVSKESTTIVGDGSSEDAVKARVRQIKNQIAETEQEYEKEKLNVARRAPLRRRRHHPWHALCLTLCSPRRG